MLVISIILGLVIMIAAGVLYVTLLYPFQQILVSMNSTFPESSGILQNLDTLYIWAPVFAILLPIFIYLLVKAMEERVRGEVYTP